MPRLTWDGTGEKKFEAGCDRGVYYPLDASGEYKPGEAWNGLVSVSETPEGGEPNSQYADNIKYATLSGAEELNGSVEAFTFPDGFAASDGYATPTKGVKIGQQARKTFGMSYRTKIGNDVDGMDHGYKLHLLYGAVVSPSERSYETINESPEAMTMSWDYTTTPVAINSIPNLKPTSLIVVDSTEVDAAALTNLENILYGGAEAGVSTADEGDTTVARLPLPDEVFSILGAANMASVQAMRSRTR